MSDFDKLKSYITPNYYGASPQDQNKIESIKQAHNQKLAALDRHIEQARQSQSKEARESPIYNKTISGRLGLDSEGTASKVVNVGAVGISELGRLAGEVLIPSQSGLGLRVKQCSITTM